jgi:DNA-binding transcriptional regulator YhcF (GntR family)
MFSDFLEIDESSKIPKYQQVADTITSDIEIGLLKVGDRIPSINETSEEFYLSRDTVEKAYKLLRKRGMITGVRGKGYYVTRSKSNKLKKILLVFNKLSDHKKVIFNSFVNTVGSGYSIDLQVHNCDSCTLEKIIIENLGRYDHYVIMPHLRHETKSVKETINKIPKERLILLNKDLDDIDQDYGCVFEDFESDIHHALRAGIDRIRKYKNLILVFPTENYHCNAVKVGFNNFCKTEKFEGTVIGKGHGHDVKKGDLYIVIEEVDLVEIIKSANSKNLKLGNDIGIIAYNDTPFKEILAGGITVLSTNFAQMGITAARMIQSMRQEKIKNPFSLIVRNSV